MVILFFAIVIVATLIPAAFWMFFFLREDKHPEPKNLLFYTFALGGLMTVPTLLFQAVAHTIGTNFILVGSVGLIITLALIEEVFKFLAAYFAVSKRPELNEPVDFMIYMVVASLGFATVENLFIVGNRLEFFGAEPLIDALLVLSLRFVGATLLHTLSSALIGYYWAKGRFRNQRSMRLVEGIILGTIVHAIFNFLVIRFEANYLIYPSLFLLIPGFFVLNDFERLKMSEEPIPSSSPIPEGHAQIV